MRVTPLKCSCGLLRINHDCEAERKKTKPKKVLIPLAELLGEIPPGKPKKKCKEKPWDGVPRIFFAWSKGFGDSKRVGRQRGFRGDKPKAIWWGNKDADYISVGKFKKGGAGRNRTLETLVSIDVVYSDIDADFPLDWKEFIEKCEKNNIPKPNLVVRTSPNHYQVRWDIPEIDKSLLGLWEKVQKGIFNLFEEFEADPQAVDAIRYLRNPSRCERVYENKVEKTSLSVMHRALKLAGFIEYEKWATKFGPNFRPMKASREKLERFLKDNPEYEITYFELSIRLGIPERTVKHLCKQFKREGRLETLVKGKGKGRKTKFIFKVHISKSFNTLPSNVSGDSGNGMVIHSEKSSGNEKKEEYLGFSQALGRAKVGGFSRGVRNFAFFGFALWLSVFKGMDYEKIYKELYPVLILTVGFSRREFEKCVKSACRDKYRYCISAKKFEKVFVSLGVESSQLLKQ